jgi:hypothetical protein
MLADKRGLDKAAKRNKGKGRKAGGVRKKGGKR